MSLIIVCLIACVGLASGLDIEQLNGCSYHAYASCAEGAECIDIDLSIPLWECKCPDGQAGDGLKGSNHTGCGRKACSLDEDCHSLAECNLVAGCNCIPGYEGDGFYSCIDKDECALEKPCHRHAECTNTEGSYICLCKEYKGYVGDGKQCNFRCSVNRDCKRTEMCRNEMCVCRNGYIDANGICEDIDECAEENDCHENAICVNEPGKYKCVCPNGFEGDGFVCKPKPTSCEDIRLKLPNSKSGVYEIDPDGAGPLNTTKVVCEMRPTLGITVFPLVSKKPTLVSAKKPKANVAYANTIDDIKAVIATSAYCYQDLGYKGKKAPTLMDGDDFWINGNGEREYSWGGSPVDGKCACGAMLMCNDNDAPCNCDGVTQLCSDQGKIIDKSKLPILGAQVVPGSNPGGPQPLGYLHIGAVKCADVSFDLPQTCHEAKYNKYMRIKKDGPQIIDVDKDGPLYPFLVYCDMRTYGHVGLTVIPHENPFPTNVTVAGEVPIKYIVEKAVMTKLLEVSEWCTQDASYDCKNSRLLNNGDRKGWFSDIYGNAKDYWPGGLQQPDQCGCGVMGMCADKNYGCNCDLADGVERKDFGVVFNKEDLPIGSITVTEIGGGSTGRYTIGPLKCGGREFGIAPTCQQYIESGYNDSSVYLIDPDGPIDPQEPDAANEPPFPVWCEMSVEPPFATTTVFHDFEEGWMANGKYEIEYTLATAAQLDLLVKRAVTCTQSVEYTCKFAALHGNNSPFTTWGTKDGRALAYFAGDGSQPDVCDCALTKPKTCPRRKNCNCDKGDKVERTDIGLLTNKFDLPVYSFNFTGLISKSKGNMKLGPLECREIFPNCGEKKVFNKKDKLPTEPIMRTGFFAIDPDGAGELDPFTVECLGTRTVVETTIEPEEPLDGKKNKPVSKCYPITYKSNGQTISPEQIQALIESSASCGQQLSQTCMNAPLTNHSNFTTCDGKTQKGWAGSRGEDKCACGVTGGCEGGPEELCNCDNPMDGKMREDSSWMLDKNRLAVCEVCVSLDPTNELTQRPKKRTVQPFVSDLFCDIDGINGAKTCQDWLDMGMDESGTQMVEPDSADEGFPVHCSIEVYPPMGITEIRPKTPEIHVPSEGIDTVIQYFVYNIKLIKAIIKQSRYCTQEMYVDCEGSTLELNGVYGWYGRSRKLQVSWAGNYEGTPTCAGGECKCNLGGNQTDGGIIIDTKQLPVMRIKLGLAGGKRTIRLGAVKCYDLYRTCHEIHKADKKTNPTKNNTYAIDPDLGGGVFPFPVVCDFETIPEIGITEVPLDAPPATTLKKKKEPESFSTPITYVSVDYDQINKLAAVSQFCYQNVQFICSKTALITGNETNGFYNTYGDQPSPSFGAAGDSNVDGCACVLTNSCPDDSLCRCDAKGPMKVDYGYETNRTVLPIQSFTFGNQNEPKASAVFSTSSVYCGPQPFYLPEDCEDAAQRGFKTGEVLIWPSTSYDPFLVHCNINRLVRRGGVTIVSPKPDTEVPVTFDEKTPVEYYQASIEQLIALTLVSEYCYQPFKITCRNTKLVTGDGYFYWEGSSSNTPRKYIGNGRWFVEECTCGQEGQCGGSEQRDVLMDLERPCSCDAGDNETRADAGVFTNKLALPIKSYNLADSGIDGAFAEVTVGNLYCGEKEFDLNECKLGFHDCHEHADCINDEDGAFECHCKAGWRGLGRPDVWANGRNCYDDDECALFMCSDRANCTNTPGDYNCTCKEGYEQLSKHKCKDIDECALGIDECDDNARCVNLIGSYDCRCRYGFRGDGFTCLPMSTCACFGDPHCLTYDNRLVDYQGLCEYVMAQDGCDGTAPTFQLLTTFTQRDIPTFAPATWVKEVTFIFKSYTVILKQDKEVWVNGRRVNLPYRCVVFRVKLVGNYVKLYTRVGLEISWNGIDVVQMHSSGRWQNKTCGLCGNYNQNPDDDLVVGPACPDEAGITDNQNLFGESWVTPGSVEASPSCAANCSATDDKDLCTGMQYQLAKAQCDKLYKTNEQFKDCLMEMDSILVDSLYHSCIYDLCRVEEDPEDAICGSAEALVETCMLSNIVVESFRTEGFCEITCGENMEYMMGGATRNCADILLDEPMPEEESQEGCYCKEGFVMDGNKCVKEEECGCIYMDEYFSVGDEVPSEGCGTVTTCTGFDTIDDIGFTCHTDANCEIRNGVYGCHCKENWLGDGIIACVKDACIPDPCGENENCIRDPEREEGYECKCSMGFVGECNNCTELDECETFKGICPQFSDCINTVGSYECKCSEGFTKFGGLCQDVNECEIAKGTGDNLCGPNSQCTNQIGEYTCPCCNGFVDNGNGTCVETEGADTGGEKCCTCEIAICNEPGKVCSEDQVQYDSIKDLIIARCEQGISPRWETAVDYFDECKNNCQDVECPMYQECVIDGATDLPTCVCEDCTGEELLKTDPVCASNLQMYPNLCVFKLMQCLMDEEAVPLDVTKPCEDKKGEAPVSEWDEWSPCSVTCGKGIRERTRSSYRPLEGYEVQDYPLTLVTECYEDPCPGSPCEGAICYAISAECVEDDQGNPVCECPECTNINKDPVCGFAQMPNGNIRFRTFPSACALSQIACENKYPDYGVINQGDCSLEPLNCTRVPDKEPRSIYGGPNNKFVSSRQIFGYGCVGSCGNVKHDCCRPSETEMIDVELVDPEDRTNKITKQVEVLKSCECVDLETVEEEEEEMVM